MTQENNEKRYSATDQMIIEAARHIKDNETVYVGVGLPMVSAMFAKHTHAPDVTVVIENGTVRSNIFPLPGATDTLGTQTWSDLLTSLFYVDCLGQAGFIDAGFLGAGQVDKFGNLNDTVVGDYRNPIHRWPGSGGANDVISFCKRTIVVLNQTKRRFVDKVDFITCPGYLDGKPGQRESVGLPPGTGPVAVVTDLGVYEFVDNEMVLTSVHTDAGVTIEQVKAEVSWDLKVSPNCRETVPPTDEELRIFREQVDPQGIWAGGRRKPR
jgi:acyl CoA:acetate/3-ketoacid CoA transferase beta subunit